MANPHLTGTYLATVVTVDLIERPPPPPLIAELPVKEQSLVRGSGEEG